MTMNDWAASRAWVKGPAKDEKKARKWPSDRQMKAMIARGLEEEDDCGCSDPGCPCDGLKRGGSI